MRNRSSQLNVTHSFTTNLGFCYLNTAAFADFAFVTQAFVFTTVTLPVLGWTKDSFTEQTITFWFQGSVVDGFRFFNLIFSGEAKPILIDSNTLNSILRPLLP